MAKKLSLSKKTKTVSIDTKRIDSLYARISSYIDDARHNIQRTVDTEIVKAYWLIGQEIVEEEQHGKKRAEYGSFLLQALSERLTTQYGRGFGLSTLRDIRKFYISYSHLSIPHALRGNLLASLALI